MKLYGWECLNLLFRKMTLNSSMKFAFLFLTCTTIVYISRVGLDEDEDYEYADETNVTEQVVHPEDLLGVDKAIASNEAIAKKLADSHPSVVLAHLTDNSPRQNDSCALYVNAMDVSHNNIYWQVQQIGKDAFYLYAAYFDNRTNLNADPAVQIIAMQDKRQLRKQNLTCQFWYKNESKPLFAPVSKQQQLWPTSPNSSDKDVRPYLLSCVPPKTNTSVVPLSVSLTGVPCENATNNLRVVYGGTQDGTEKGFAVCVTALEASVRPFVSVLPVRLVEWIEMLKILGAEKIVFHEMKMNPNVSKVLQHYAKSGLVDVIGLSLPGHFLNVPHLMHSFFNFKPHIRSVIEAIAYNDCLYKYKNQFEFIVVLDIFEVIVPKIEPDWRTLLSEKIKKSPAASFSVKSAVFVDDKAELHDWSADVPKHMHMLQHTYRNVNASFGTARSFQNAKYSSVLAGGSPSICAGGAGHCLVEPVDARVHKYCVGRQEEACQTERGAQLKPDAAILRFKEKLIPASNGALEDLGLVTFKRGDSP